MKFLFPIILCFFFFSCESTDKEIVQNVIQPVQDQKITNGEFIDLHDNGQIKTQGNLVDGKRDGLWQTFFHDGIKQSESTYKHGVLNGKTASYYYDGKTRYVGFYEKDLKSGTWYFYTEDGTFEKEVNYKDGKLVK